ncbi:MAG TPA: hypothetical protein RMH85_19765 [Polyangiaceae bacterium LLY-WYZ-15_(1-7)]|nr:hypothetical protein [Myxococcales bacterium]MAT26137.1 hypothetical protein [Sandaracinus sp.]HJK90208.1 hypothetical protein [Polyangiaceae bacterium LLY-WYZ-15_(1-7)]MBJ73469.1 hypothetical protein [Sandaracinus sp.]HJL00494.1 hypothetical protein [Polyangiaceae bacterium LLY-WYZ-15_(1-7)]
MSARPLAIFERPERYCDRRCERCPQRGRCSLAATLATGEESLALAAPHADPATLEPPGSPDFVVTQIGAAELAALMESESAMLRGCGTTYGWLVRAQIQGVAPRAERLEVERLAEQIGPCCKSISMGLERDADASLDVWGPSLLVLENVLARLDAGLARLLAEPERRMLQEIRADLDRRLRPLQERIPRAARDALARAIAEGRAPSPFLVVAPVSPAA